MNEYILIKVSINGKQLASYSFDSLPINIGRGPECQVVLDNPGISRLHAKIEAGEDYLRLVDMGSENGTFANGKQIIEETQVTGADTIRIGKFTLNIRTSAVPGTTELPSAANIHSEKEDIENHTIQLSAEDRRRVLMQASALKASQKKPKKASPNYLPWVAVLAVGLVLGFLLSKLN